MNHFYFLVKFNPLFRTLSLTESFFILFVIVLVIVLLEIEIPSLWFPNLFELVESLNWSKDGTFGKKLFPVVYAKWSTSTCGISILDDYLGGFTILYLGGWMLGEFVENLGLPSNEGLLRASC